MKNFYARAPYVNAAVGYTILTLRMHTCCPHDARAYIILMAFFILCVNLACIHDCLKYFSTNRNRCAVRCLVDNNTDYDRDQRPLQVSYQTLMNSQSNTQTQYTNITSNANRPGRHGRGGMYPGHERLAPCSHPALQPRRVRHRVYRVPLRQGGQDGHQAPRDSYLGLHTTLPIATDECYSYMSLIVVFALPCCVVAGGCVASSRAVPRLVGGLA